MTPVSPISPVSDLASMLTGSETPRDTDSSDRFASALQTASGDKVVYADKRGEPLRKGSDPKNSKADRDERPGGRKELAANSSDLRDADREPVVANDGTITAPPNATDGSASSKVNPNLEALSAGVSSGQAFVSELSTAIATAANATDTAAAGAPNAALAASVVPIAAGPSSALNAPAVADIAGTPTLTADATNIAHGLAQPTVIETAPASSAAVTQEAPVARMIIGQLAPPITNGISTPGDAVQTNQNAVGQANSILPNSNGIGANVLSTEGLQVVTNSQVAAGTASNVIPAEARNFDAQLVSATDVTKLAASPLESVKAELPQPVAPTMSATLTSPTAINEASPVKAANMPLPMEPFKQVIQLVTPLLNRGNGDYSLTMQLHPAELGSIQVQVSLTNGQISMQLQSDNPQARQNLQESMKDLRASLEASGLSTGSLDVSTGSQGDRAKNSANGDGSAKVSGSVTDEDQTNFLNRLATVGFASSNSSTTGDGPLDVRV